MATLPRRVDLVVRSCETLHLRVQRTAGEISVGSRSNWRGVAMGVLVALFVMGALLA